MSDDARATLVEDLRRAGWDGAADQIEADGRELDTEKRAAELMTQDIAWLRKQLADRDRQLAELREHLRQKQITLDRVVIQPDSFESISAKEALRTEYIMEMQRQLAELLGEPCPDCGGDGSRRLLSRCINCKGSGRVGGKMAEVERELERMRDSYTHSTRREREAAAREREQQARIVALEQMLAECRLIIANEWGEDHVDDIDALLSRETET